ncbi:MAG: hypothetical protein WC728_02150 [Elusimicrobiota bacterium]
MKRAPLAFLALALGLAGWFIASSAPVFDEPAHLASGYSVLRTGRYRNEVMIHPPFAEAWAALPLLVLPLEDFFSHPDYADWRIFHHADRFLYRNRMPAARILGAARAFNLLTWLPLVFAVLILWSRRIGGELAAVSAAGAAALTPALLSNFSLATADAAPAALWFASFWLLRESTLSSRRGETLAAAAGVCAGLAAASKFNMILLMPTALALLALQVRGDGRRCARLAALFCLCSSAALALVYRVTYLPLYFQDLAAALSELKGGRASFLFGRHLSTGHWAYFPTALLVKTPIPVLALCFAGCFFKTREAFWIFIPPAVYLAAAMACPTQIGIRHLLPVIPFMLLLAGLGAAELCSRKRGKTLVLALGLWAGVSVGASSPHLLAYFNEAVGGPARGYRVLVDSNLDWGQALPDLGRYLRREGSPTIFLSYFGTADPAAYGIRYVPVLFPPHVDRPGNAEGWDASGRVLFAVSATNLQGVYFSDPGLLGWLKSRKPVRTFGYSIFLYDLADDAQGQALLVRLLADPRA